MSPKSPRAGIDSKFKDVNKSLPLNLNHPQELK